MKLSWPSDLRTREACYLRMARDKGVKAVAVLCGDQSITSIKDMRDGLEFPAPYRFLELLTRFKELLIQHQGSGILLV